MGNINEDYDVAETLRENYEYLEAIEKLDAILKQNPDFFNGLISKAQIQYQCESFNDALITYQKAIEINPESSIAWNGVARSQMGIGLYKEAKLSIEKTLTIDLNFGAAWSTKGALEELHGNYSKSEEYFKKALDLDPSNLYIYLDKIRYLLRQKQFYEADHLIEKGLKIDPKCEPMMVRKAIMNIMMLRYEDVDKILDQCLEINPISRFALVNKGYLQIRLENYPMAEKHFTDVLDLYPYNLQTMSYLGLVFEKQGKLENAKSIAKKIVKSESQEFYDLLNKARAYQILENNQKYFELLNRVLSINPYEFDTLLRLGYDLIISGDYDNAWTYFKRAESINQTDLGVVMNLGVVAQKKGNLQEALGYYQKGLEIEPENIRICLQIAQLCRVLKDYHQEITQYERILKLDKVNIPAIGNMGIAFGNLKQYENAQNCFSEIIKLDPKDPHAWENKAHYYLADNNYVEAEDTCDKRIELNQDDSAFRMKGNVLENLGKFNEAILCYEKALEINDRNIQTLLDIGLAFSTSNPWTNIDKPSLEKAIYYYQKAHNVDPLNDKVWQFLGSVNEKYGNYEESLEWYSKALNKNSRDVILLYRMGSVNQNLGKDKEAVHCYQKIIEVDKKFLQSLASFGMRFAAAVNIEIKKRNVYSDGIELEDYNPLTFVNVVAAYKNLGRVEDAEKVEGRMLEFGSNTNMLSYQIRGNELEMLERYDTAKLMYERSLKLEPNNQKAIEALKRITKHLEN